MRSIAILTAAAALIKRCDEAIGMAHLLQHLVMFSHCQISVFVSVVLGIVEFVVCSLCLLLNSRSLPLNNTMSLAEFFSTAFALLTAFEQSRRRVADAARLASHLYPI